LGSVLLVIGCVRKTTLERGMVCRLGTLMRRFVPGSFDEIK
jgi:hypothetical protein